MKENFANKKESEVNVTNEVTEEVLADTEETMVNEVLPQVNEDEEKIFVDAPTKKTNTLLKILSFLIPIVGIVLFFVKKKESVQTAKAYLKSAIAGFATGVAIVLIFGIVSTAIVEKQKREMAEKEDQFIITKDGEEAIVIDGIPVIIQDIDDGEEDFDKENYDVVVDASSIDEAINKTENEAEKLTGVVTPIE